LHAEMPHIVSLEDGLSEIQGRQLESHR
jgi:hypothetical protein